MKDLFIVIVIYILVIPAITYFILIAADNEAQNYFEHRDVTAVEYR